MAHHNLLSNKNKQKELARIWDNFSVYDGLKPTTKTKKDYKKLYREIKQRLISEGKFVKNPRAMNKAIIQEIGEFPYWNVQGTPKQNNASVEFGTGMVHEMSGGEPRPTDLRRASQDTAAEIRALRTRQANELMIAAGFGKEVKEGSGLFSAKHRVGGKAWDHKYELQDFGPRYNQILEDFASGSIEIDEFKTRVAQEISKNPGDIRRNLELLDEADNNAKRARVEAEVKDFKLAESYKVRDAKYTEFQQLDDVTKTQRLEKAHQRALDITKSMRKTNKWNGLSDVLTNPPENYEVDYVARNGNGVNGNGVNGNGVNGRNGNGLAVNGKNGKNGILKGLDNVTNYSGITKVGRSADQLINIGLNASTGNYGGAAIGAATFATSKALQDPKVQARVAKQITQLVAERSAKSAAKFIPGLDVVLSGKESWDYLKRGRWDQAGIAALSGAIGWIPLIGDGASAALDLSNTGIDIARLQAPTGDAKKKGRNRLSRYLRGFNN